ncbi:MAG: hypothetical protein JNM78_16630 [Cyclobacteriaceae bacterium]|nr:hypothetical protein [Cyclobacteriaceae bacterium]
MKLSNEQYSIVAAFFELLIATIYTLICLSNYMFDWLDFEVIKSLKNLTLFQIISKQSYEPDLTWCLAGFNAILFAVHLVIYKENEVKKKKDFGAETFGVGIIPFLMAIGLYFAIDYRNDLIILTTGIFATVNFVLFISEETRNYKEQKK